MATRAMNVKMEESTILAVKKAASVYNVTITEIVRDALDEYLEKLQKDGVLPDQIAILSTLRFENSVVHGLDGYPLTTDYKDRKGRILFSTVHTFKGLDSPVVILTDINHFYYANNKMMLYVGMSRAKSVLYMLCREKTLKDIQAFSKERQ